MDAMVEYPAEFANSIRVQAESDAEALAAWFCDRNLLPHADSNLQVTFPPEVLLGIALALRFRRWELHHISLHVDAGLPTSNELFERLSKLAFGKKMEQYVTRSWVLTIQIIHESLLWSAVDCDLSVDIAVVAAEDEQFLDAVADFLLNSQKG